MSKVVNAVNEFAQILIGTILSSQNTGMQNLSLFKNGYWWEIQIGSLLTSTQLANHSMKWVCMPDVTYVVKV